MAQARRRFLVDENGRRTSVVLPIGAFQELMEDLEDLAIMAERNEEPAEALEAVRKRLKDQWLNTELSSISARSQ